MSIALRLAEALHRFNAKERNHLMRFALLGETDGGPPKQSAQWVHPNFFESLRGAVAGSPGGGSAIELSPSARCVYAAMDYHLDWLHGALWLVGKKSESAPDQVSHAIETRKRDNEQWDVMGNQEDIDLLLVIADGATTHLVCVEAKGDDAFSDEQLLSKFRRLKLILSGDESEVMVSLVLLAPDDLASKAANSQLINNEAPTRFGGRIVSMNMPNFPAELDRVTRCDASGKNPKGLKRETRQQDLPYWTIKQRKRSPRVKQSKP